MTSRIMLRVDAALSDEFLGAFPNLSARKEGPTSTLVGELADQQDLQGVLALLESLGVSVLEVIVIPD